MQESLRFSAAMLSELRTSQLSPQKYYELYMMIFDQLADVEAHSVGTHSLPPGGMRNAGANALRFYGCCNEAIYESFYESHCSGSAECSMLVLGIDSLCACTLPAPQAFFGDERSKGRTYAELYEMVQHAGNVLPRL
eukprot:scaffold182025_cov14-Tisochrysis_lutea.AAC.1